MNKTENSQTTEYHNTFLLLSKYRDVVWSLEVTTKKTKSKFTKEMGCDIEEYLDTVHLAGYEFSDSGIQEHTKVIEQSANMLRILETAIDILKNKHKYGETYYWVLYYSFLSPKQYNNTAEIIRQLSAHVKSLSYKTYFRKRKEAVKALSMILWGYAAKESIDILDTFIPQCQVGLK